MNKELEIELMKMFIRHNVKEILELEGKITKLDAETKKYQQRLDYLKGND